MTIIKNKRTAVVIKLSPTGRLCLAWRPSKYPKTRTQILFGEISRACGVRKGMSKTELVTKSMPCIRDAWDKRRGRATQDHEDLKRHWEKRAREKMAGDDRDRIRFRTRFK